MKARWVKVLDGYVLMPAGKPACASICKHRDRWHYAAWRDDGTGVAEYADTLESAKSAVERAVGAEVGE